MISFLRSARRSMRGAPQILAVEVQEIEGKEHEPMRRRVDRRSKGIEVGKAVLVLDDHLAIDHGTSCRPACRKPRPPAYRPSSSHCRCG